MRKNNPQLKALVDEFVQGDAVGTAFGNTLLRRYLQNTKWIKNFYLGNGVEEIRSHGRTFPEVLGRVQL